MIDCMNGYASQIMFLSPFVLGIAVGVLGALAGTRDKLPFNAGIYGALTGIFIAVVVSGEKNELLCFLLGSVCFIVSSLLSSVIQYFAKASCFVAHSLVASLNFATSALLFAHIYVKSPLTANELNRYLFGGISLSLRESSLSIFVSAISVIIVFLFVKRLRTIAFSSAISCTSGIPSTFYNTLCFLLTTFVSVISIYTIGVVFAIILYIVPFLIAKSMLRTFISILLFSGLLGGMLCGIGCELSDKITFIPTGAIIAILSGFVLLGCLIFRKKAKKHGSI